MMAQWPADKVERWPIAKLVPYARNSRTHSPAQVEQIARAIEEWGWTNPILVDEKGGIIAGHGRVMAARKLGLTEVPVMAACGWTEAQKRAYVLADNQIALNADWDKELLALELGELREGGFDLSLAGFDDGALGLFLPDSAAAAGIETAPLTASFWISVRGPFVAQAEALAALRVLAGVPGVEIASNLRDGE